MAKLGPLVVEVAGILAFMLYPCTAQDTVLVHSNNAAVWGDQVHLVEDLRIGELHGADEYVFGRISYIAANSGGAIYVTDNQVPVIRQYDSTGAYVRDIGREGEGPGEYRGVLGLHVIKGERLMVWDPRLSRVTVFDSSGSFLYSHLVSRLSRARNPIDFAVDTSGAFYIEYRDYERASGRVAISPGERVAQVASGNVPRMLIKFSPGGDILDTIPLPHVVSGSKFVLITPQGMRWNFPLESCFAWSPLGYLIVGHNSDYVFDLHIPDAPIRRIKRDFEPVTIHRAERVEWEAWARRFESRGNFDYPAIPRTKPAYRELHVAADGRIWVERYVTAVRRGEQLRQPDSERPPFEWSEPTTFDVLQPDGTFLGTVVMPDRTRARFTRGDRVWGVLRGEFDEEYVVR